MKAKEYFAQWESNERTVEALAEIVTMFIKELKTTIDTRNIKTDDGLQAAVKELYQKWISFCTMALKNSKNEDAQKQFRALFPRTLIDVYPALKPWFNERGELEQ
jgi:hypothetical protein